MTAAKLTIPCPHVPGATAPVACAECIAAYAAQVREEALEEAADVIKSRADLLYAWMEKEPIHTPKRTEKSLRAGELYAAERLVRALAAKEPKP